MGVYGWFGSWHWTLIKWPRTGEENGEVPRDLGVPYVWTKPDWKRLKETERDWRIWVRSCSREHSHFRWEMVIVLRTTVVGRATEELFWWVCIRFSPRNILTGIFVDSALQNGQEEKRRFLLQEVGQVFLAADKARWIGQSFGKPTSANFSHGAISSEAMTCHDQPWGSNRVVRGAARSSWLGWISRLSWRIHTCSNSFTPWMWMTLGDFLGSFQANLPSFGGWNMVNSQWWVRLNRQRDPKGRGFPRETTCETTTSFLHAEADWSLRWSTGGLASASLTWHWHLAFADDVPHEKIPMHAHCSSI